MSVVTNHVVSAAWSQIVCTGDIPSLQNVGPYPVRLYIGSVAPAEGAPAMVLHAHVPPQTFDMDPGDLIYVQLAGATPGDASSVLAKWE